MSICVISFSSRRSGNCAQISKFVCSLLPEAKSYNFCDFKIQPCGECNYECFYKNDDCPWISDNEYEILDAVTKSSRTYFILPNYCDFPCANFFIFNERSQCYFQHNEDLLNKYEQVPKKAVVVSNTNEENFIAALRYHSENDIPILFMSAKKYGKKSIDGNLLTSEQAVEDLRKFIFEY